MQYHLTTIWLFTFTDLKTIVGPKTAFGILSALSGPILTKNACPDVSEILSRIPRTAFWCWINLLPFAIDNQRRPEAIQEDSKNKPWRSMPSKRISERQAEYLMWTLYPVALISSFYWGGLKQCLGLMFLGSWYNDLGGADCSCIIRNFINACGFLSFATGATEVASRTQMLENPFNNVASQWFLIVGAIVFSSVQSQDMYDQVGDGLRKRKTVPLVIGDSLARWTIAIPVGLWSVFCPMFWKLGIVSYAVSVTLGSVIIYRTLIKRTVADDKLTFRLWNMWLVCFYLMPVLKRHQGSTWI